MIDDKSEHRRRSNRFFREHKPQPKRLGVEEEDGGTGVEEAVSFIDLPNTPITKLPEKGILKKHGGYGIVMPDSCNTSENDDSRFFVKNC